MLDRKTPIRSTIVAAAAAAALIATPGLASAAAPKEGSYHWQGKCPDVPGAPCPTEQFNFSVKEGKIKDFTYTSYSCGFNELQKTIKVKSNGKFKVKGSVENPGGQLTPIRLNGKFVSSRKAKGKLSIDYRNSCAEDVTYKFVAKYEG